MVVINPPFEFAKPLTIYPNRENSLCAVRIRGVFLLSHSSVKETIIRISYQQIDIRVSPPPEAGEKQKILV